MMGRKIHPREKIVEEAEGRLRDVVTEAMRTETKDLTWGEYLRVLSNVFGDLLSRAAKYMIRQERHPDDPDKPGGLE